MKRRCALAGLVLLALCTPVLAGQLPPRPREPVPPERPDQRIVVQPLTLDEQPAARETRDRLQRLLGQYPPSVRQVLRLDTSLLTRQDYLATYPALAALLEQHPEVVHNPR